jgi:hypothetical protein
MHLGLGSPSMVTVVKYTLPPVTIGDDTRALGSKITGARQGVRCTALLGI